MYNIDTPTETILRNKNIKAIFFDMDGILFNSMPYHAEAWHKALLHFGLEFSPYEAYLHEGRTADSTIDAIYNRLYGHDADRTTKDEIYALKSSIFGGYPAPKPIEGIAEVLQWVKQQNIHLLVVTGSAQVSLFEKLQEYFPAIFERNHIVSAFEVKHGKPHPEPYLTALKIAGVDAEEALVIENAPLGIRSGRAAGIFTIGVNTGILTRDDLKEAGANLVLDNMQQLRELLKELNFVHR